MITGMEVDGDYEGESLLMLYDRIHNLSG